ncbi:KH domain protein [Methanothermus fervidus DSM 2088]|uniref:KH domain protein n=1 Tax=Methanothermus fervidus (strain ATCC 43054 / DSM 2088 / JCM 10308 / V24 S) TaxID=523846 RepID=E3GXR4_METFV|nr:KH domain-containing protein [Methanothermus fervidus]ADP77096.1 KH domain protein [Methanothermus fervidus DSM 2088]
MVTEEYIRIPRERIGVLIGKNGSTKKHIENSTQTKLEIDSESGMVTIIPKSESIDPMYVLKARDIVRAIGRGFSPEVALRLLNEDVMLDVIDISDYVGRSKKAIRRQKGRIIGKDGKTRQIIENMTGANISVYGKTVALIGDLEEIRIAREAVEMLLEGAKHGTVYRFLEKKQQEMKVKRFKETFGIK